MQHLPFKPFSKTINAKFESMIEQGMVLVRSNVNRSDLYELYLSSFPEELKTIFRERQHYDGNADKNYIYRLGNVIGIDKENNLHSIWDVTVDGYFQQVVDNMSSFVKSSDLTEYFYTSENRAGSLSNVDNYNKDIIWDHFYSIIPEKYIKEAEYVGSINTTLQVFKRSMKDFRLEDAILILDLINENSLPQGPTYKQSIESLIQHLSEYNSLETEELKRIFCFKTCEEGLHYLRYRSTVIGTFLEHLAEGKDFEFAFESFCKKVDPVNYKRTTATFVSPSMIKQAEEKLSEKGLLDSIYRRCATLQDIPVNKILYTAVTQKSLNIFSEMKEEVNSQISKKSLNNIEEISVKDFISNVLPNTQNLEVLFENDHTNNLMTLTTSDDSVGLFKWNNNFAWAYNGDVADSLLRQQVEKLGGRVDGALRFSHTWNYDSNKPNQSLMDLHVFFGKGSERINLNSECHNSYPSCPRVGWNQRKHAETGGIQDVDYVEAPGTNVPVENITFPDVSKMPEGLYVFKVHNWKLRQPTTSGFKAEVEVNGGEIHSFEYTPALKNHEWITVATATLKNGVFTVTPILESEKTSKEVWGLNTNSWVKVNKVMESPNYWDENSVGNNHLFFMIDNCKTTEPVRGFYNEFLNNDLTPLRKFFEILGNRTKITDLNNQLSGLGFNSTSRKKLVVRCKDKQHKIYQINF